MARTRSILRLSLLLWLLAAAPALHAQGAVDTRPEVRDVAFTGATSFPSELLRNAIVTRETVCRNPALLPVCWLGFARAREHLDEVVLEADVLRLRIFYYQRGYRAARVEARTSPVAGGVRVVFAIDEGRPVRVTSIEIASADPLFQPIALRRTLPLRVGAPFNLLDYEAARDTLLGRLTNLGYAHAEVLASYLIPADSPYQAQLHYELVPGARARFGTIEIQGTQRVSSSVVRRMLTFRRGDLYEQDELLRSQRNLYGLDIFRHAEIRARLAEPPDSVVAVTVQVNEGNVHRVRVGVGLSSAECFNAEARWTSRNFLGGARRLELRSQVSNVLASAFHRIGPCFDAGAGRYGDLTGSLAADFTQPWFFDALNTAGAGLFAERRSLPDVFVRTGYGGSISLTRSLGPGTAVSLAYRPELTELDAEGDLFFCISFVACAGREIEVLDEPHWLAPLRLSYARDHTNALFAPTRGYILRLDGELAMRATGSDFGYTRLALEGSWYREIAPGLVFATRMRPGWARATGEPGGADGLGLHPQRRFFAGGPNSVRGFAQHRLGPKVLTVNAARVLAAPVESGGAGCAPEAINDGSCDAGALAPGRFDVRPVGGALAAEGNLELRFPLLGKFRGAAFLDVGQVWSEGGDVDLDELAWTPGLGVRYFSPVGPIRVDVGYNALGGESLSVITTRVCPAGGTRPDGNCENAFQPGIGYGPANLENTNRLKVLNEPVFWNPRRSLLERMQLHISIGQAF